MILLVSQRELGMMIVANEWSRRESLLFFFWPMRMYIIIIIVQTHCYQLKFTSGDAYSWPLIDPLE